MTGKPLVIRLVSGSDNCLGGGNSQGTFARGGRHRWAGRIAGGQMVRSAVRMVRVAADLFSV